MDETTNSTPLTATGSAASGNYQKLAEQLLEQESGPEMQLIRQLILLRTAMEGEIKDSKIPAPKNITEVGGYYNLLERQNEQIMLRQLVSSALGLPNQCAPEATEQTIRVLLNRILREAYG